MQKILFGIFAHPDDEAFGPAATLLGETLDGRELHLISLTAGENGMNPDNHPNLGEVRLEEWRKAGRLIGAASMEHLGYEDGTLGNNNHVAITGEIENIVRKIVNDRTDIEVEFMSYDLNGVTGHIDHIVAGRSACLAFYRLREQGLPMKRIRLACMAYEHHQTIDTSFVFMEPGRKDDEVDEVIDRRDLLDRVQEIIHAHHTQRSDGKNALRRGDAVAINHFIVKD